MDICFDYEKKLLLSEEEYEIIREAVDGSRSGAELLINRYFDTATFDMDKKGITCRVRQKDGRSIATVKCRDANNGGKLLQRSSPVNGRSVRNVFESEGLICFGSLLTERRAVCMSDHCMAFVDKNTYLGTVDYELEVMYCEGSEKEVDRLIKGIARRFLKLGGRSDISEFCHRAEECESKGRRFFDRKRRIIDVQNVNKNKSSKNA